MCFFTQQSLIFKVVEFFSSPYGTMVNLKFHKKDHTWETQNFKNPKPLKRNLRSLTILAICSRSSVSKYLITYYKFIQYRWKRKYHINLEYDYFFPKILHKVEVLVQDSLELKLEKKSVQHGFRDNACYRRSDNGLHDLCDAMLPTFSACMHTAVGFPYPTFGQSARNVTFFVSTCFCILYKSMVHVHRLLKISDSFTELFSFVFYISFSYYMLNHTGASHPSYSILKDKSILINPCNI